MNERLSGVLVHPTSFPSKFGIGDLGKGAYKFIDFLEENKQKLWQILPLGPTSFGDSPYQSFSTFAGNYLLISPEILVEEGYLKEKDLREIPDFEDRKIDYGKVIKYKNELFKKAFDNFLKMDKSKKTEYNDFCKKNESWLEDYVLYISLKHYFIEERRTKPDRNEYENFLKAYDETLGRNLADDFYFGAVWSTWPADISQRTRKGIEKYKKKLALEMEYQRFLQYEFFRQWLELKKYANERDIKIIGDIPIFVAYDGCDAWANKELFKLDDKGFPLSVAGVPPDYFSITGQLWGNPLYDWEKNKEKGYEWWIERIKSCITNTDIVRIDHFRGFDTYWEIPFGEKTAIEGKWQKGPGSVLFEAVENKLGKLPIIAEDLGELSPSVEVLRKKLGFPGMKILQFAFGGDNQNDYLPHNITEVNSVIYTGTHDNDTSFGWYQNASGIEQDYFRRYLNVSGDDAAWDLIRLAFSSVCKYAIIPIQDIMCLDSFDRMNIPGVPSNNWQFRYTEDMLSECSHEGLKYLSMIYGRNGVKLGD